ncbi:metallophosphoesterase [Micromonospora sp. NBRC 107095]|uniref:metallophosphoesterase family protein n=1 Tax=Micromonospora TaxID=1873 RepID=UPI0025565D23|nr:metallophosphoesterase [Micromonospora sp. NBRC 107095]
MTDLTIMHLSDVHFGAAAYAVTPAELLSKATAVAKGLVDPAGRFVVALTGDVTTKGSPAYYEEAARGIERHLLAALDPDQVLVCPGNHDITGVAPAYFQDFNEFAFRLTNDNRQVFTPERTVARVDLGDYSFLMVNSSYHGDHRRGEVQLAHLRRAMSDSRPNPIILLHHSPFSSEYGGHALVNAYEFLSLAVRNRVAGILHGHVHFEQVLTIGSRPTAVVGSGSLLFPPAPNHNNQFTVIQLSAGGVERAVAAKYDGDRGDFTLVETEFS